MRELWNDCGGLASCCRHFCILSVWGLRLRNWRRCTVARQFSEGLLGLRARVDGISESCVDAVEL
ncbi:hypothetical protein L207DRAFT_252076 [Hyaloscypha variabilis F]|jgi:hypothetical protein|uniref:Uncharacterized protein n=1 Tax=Hyaloscypha variabilis (strain UAMH 11265 / GT02V1 / F) TaxID=1149755 RepID=A0A2J6S3E5_HYAVF|nr:hypothetical protein L207DRAFT_252076 [Hyaloscypha variabilis F]